MPEGGIQEQQGPSLTDLDDAAIEALIEGGWESGSLPEALRRRVIRLERLLSAAEETCPPADETLTDLTLLRCRREGARRGPEPELLEDDRDALDALVSSGYRPARVPATLRERARRHLGLVRVVGESPTGATPSWNLTDRTMARIENDVRAREETLQFEAQAARRGVRLRLGDAVAVAALLLLSVSLIAPAIANMREQWTQRICHSNTLAAAMGLGSYALDNQGSLPVVTAGSNRPWWSVGDPSSSNSANLFHLASERYVGVGDLACAGNEHALRRLPEPGLRDWRELDEVSYSYQVMNGRMSPGWAQPSRMVVVADRSPVVRKAVARLPIDPFENSANHGGRGQHVLYNDGSAEWRASPVLESGDNIWLPRPLEAVIDRAVHERFGHTLHGTERPGARDDTFLGP